MAVASMLRLMLCLMERATALAIARSVLDLSRSVNPVLLIRSLQGYATERSRAWALIRPRNGADPCAALRCVA